MLLLSVLESKAQQEYLYTENLDAYVGTWKYEAANETFILVLRKAALSTDLFYGSCLTGGYKHIKNGKIIADYTANLPSTITNANFNIPNCPTFFGDNGCVRPDCVTPNEVDFFLWDKAYGDKRLHGCISLIASASIHFEVWQNDDISGRAHNRVITVPTDIILHKVYSNGGSNSGQDSEFPDPLQPLGQTANPQLP